MRRVTAECVRRLHPLREILLLGGAYAAYKTARVAADGQTSPAYRNARRVWDFERLVGLPSEASVQRALLASETLAQAVNAFYATAHYAVTATFLVWMYLRRPGHYGWARNTLILLTAAALVLHFVMPLAPPRLLPELGLVDTGARYGPSVYGPPQDDALNNQYAAMPSLHVGWALAVAVGLLVTTSGWWRWLWLAYPAAVLLTVVGTAHHFWVDGLVAAVLLGAILLLLRRAHSLGALSNTEDAQVAA